MDISFNNLVKESKSILILVPTNPHFDHVAAALSLYLGLSGKKETAIVCPTPMLVEFNRLVGVDKVVQELGNKNLIIRFQNYPVNDLEKISYEIENGEIKIKVEPKQGFAAPKKEDITFNHAGVVADLVLLIGGGHDGHFPHLTNADLKQAKCVHIGVKSLTLSTGIDILSLATSASSVSELAAAFLKEADFEINADIATNLITGIEEGSRGYSTAEVTADTFAKVSELMRLGGKRVSRDQMPDKRNFPPGAIPGRSSKSWYEPKVYKGGSGTPVS